MGKVEYQGKVFTVPVRQEVLEAHREVGEASDVDHGPVPMAWGPEVEATSRDGGWHIGTQLVLSEELNIVGGWRGRMLAGPEKDHYQARGHDQDQIFSYPFHPHCNGKNVIEPL